MKTRTRNSNGCCAGPLSFQDEGTNIGSATVLDFVGDNIQAVREGNKVTIFSTGSSSGGGSTLTDWPIASGPPVGSIAQGKRYRLTGSPGTILGESVAEGTTMEALIPNPTVRADWYFNFGGS